MAGYSRRRVALGGGSSIPFVGVRVAEREEGLQGRDDASRETRRGDAGEVDR